MPKKRLAPVSLPVYNSKSNMQIIKPREISGRILTLVEEAEDHLMVVSPYVNISKWSKVTDALDRARSRGVKITFYVRQDQEDRISQLARVASSVYLVDRLHAKLYLNEKAAVFTSFNLILASDEKSTDLGIYTEDPSLLEEFRSFVTKYLDTVSTTISEGNSIPKDSNETSWINVDKISHEETGKVLHNLTPQASWRDATNYWFSSDALPPGDVMVGHGFVWKLYRAASDVFQNVKWIQERVPVYASSLADVEVDHDHSKYIYVTIVPKAGYAPSDFLIDLFAKLLGTDSTR